MVKYIPSFARDPHGNEAHEPDFVDKVSDETINGIKTFGSIPILPASNPTTDNQATRKAYVDSKVVKEYDNYFHYYCNWESIDNYAQAGVTAYTNQIKLETGYPPNTLAYIQKRLYIYPPFIWWQVGKFPLKKFKTKITISQITTGQTAYIGIGTNVGFKIVDNKLYGFANNGTTEWTVLLETFTAGTNMNLEMIFTGDSVNGYYYHYYVDGVDKGQLGGALGPSGTTDYIQPRFSIDYTSGGLQLWVYYYEIFWEKL